MLSRSGGPCGSLHPPMRHSHHGLALHSAERHRHAFQWNRSEVQAAAQYSALPSVQVLSFSCSLQLLAPRGLPHGAPGLRARQPACSRAGEGLWQPDRHKGCNRAGFPPSVAPLVTPTQRLSATAGLVAVCLRASSSGPFSRLPVRATSRPRWGPGSHHPVTVASPGLAFGFRLRLRSQCVSDFNFTAGSGRSSSFMRLPS
ncbi:hypothetical protein NDU88_006428 [Pleurodeles waltl]|uniref:Uncharacterized protein n=1 Tax=Pleurodeles waltl TaxID=8319 RepID=A0AAV7QHJ5_PLEWA|nr:hypothetical protein NDU88_006428 [Pleurodeles waltl]